jgi:hypothetical protein
MANSYNDTSNNIARLYAGMQPLAAQGLTSIGGLQLGSAGSPSPGAAAGVYGMGMQNAAQGAAGFGTQLYNSLNKLRNLGGNKGPDPSVINGGIQNLMGAF